MYWLPRAAVTSHKPGGFKQHQLFSLSSGDKRSLAWVYRRGAFIEESLKERPFPALLQLLVLASSPWHSYCCGHIALTSASVFTWPSFPSYKDTTPVGFKDHPPCDLILITLAQTQLPRNGDHAHFPSLCRRNSSGCSGHSSLT